VSRDPGGEGVMPHHPVFNLWPTVRFLFLAACVVWIVFFAVSDSSDPTVPATTTVLVLVGLSAGGVRIRTFGSATRSHRRQRDLGVTSPDLGGG
jgi:hypothetical protein